MRGVRKEVTEEACEEDERCEEDLEFHSSAKRTRVCATFESQRNVMANSPSYNLAKHKGR